MNPLALLLGTDAIAPQTNDLGFTFSRPSYAAGFVNTPSAPPPQMPQQGPPKFRNFLGALGDALSVANGGEPYYRKQAQDQRISGALQGFLTNPDQAIAALLKVDPVSAITLYKAVHPPSEVPDTAKVYEYRQHLSPDEQAAFDRVSQMLHPGMMAPITLGPNDSYDAGGAPTGGEITATGPNGEKVRYNPQNHAWEPMGGATGNPSRPFPGR